jgi:CDP-glucose 4,6-dehydratase
MENLKKFWKKKKVLITGHTGFKGSWLCIILNLLEAKIYGYSLAPKKNSLFLKSKIQNSLISNTYADINDLNKLKKFVKKNKPEIIFHLAAQPLVLESYKNPINTFSTNILGTVNLLEVVRKTNSIKSIIIITTDKVYKVDKKNISYSETDELGGYDPYSSSKVCTEVIVNSYVQSFFTKTKLKNKIATVRAGNVIGGGDYSENRLVPDIIRAINGKKKLLVRNPTQIRPWQHVLDPLMGYMLLAEKQYNNKIKILDNCWNFGPNTKNFKKVIEIIKFFKKFINFEYKIELNKKYNETKILKLNSVKAKKILKWRMKWDINKTLKKTIEWNNLVKKGKSVKSVCESQILSYLKTKKPIN